MDASPFWKYLWFLRCNHCTDHNFTFTPIRSTWSIPQILSNSCITADRTRLPRSRGKRPVSHDATDLALRLTRSNAIPRYERCGFPGYPFWQQKFLLWCNLSYRFQHDKVFAVAECRKKTRSSEWPLREGTSKFVASKTSHWTWKNKGRNS